MIPSHVQGNITFSVQAAQEKHMSLPVFPHRPVALWGTQAPMAVNRFKGG